jgi:Phage Tail Collar Domain
MAEVTGYTSARMKMIEDETVVDGRVDGNDLILIQRNLDEINAGNVRGPAGPVGPAGSSSIPVGAVIDFYGSAAPEKFLECIGGTFDGETWPELAAHLGGTTLPDLRDLGTVGRSAAHALGTKFGSSNPGVGAHGHANTLTAPAHTHPINPPSTTTSADAHTHTTSSMKLGAQGTTNFGFTLANGANGPTANSNNASSSDSHSHTVDIAQFNSGAASSTTIAGGVTAVAESGTNYHPVMAMMKCIRAAT